MFVDICPGDIVIKEANPSPSLDKRKCFHDNLRGTANNCHCRQLDIDFLWLKAFPEIYKVMLWFKAIGISSLYSD